MHSVVDSFTVALAAVASTAAELSAGLSADATVVRALLADLKDDELLAAQRSVAKSRRQLDACAALLAGQIAHRSRRDLGHAGLAQREGFRSPEALLQHTTGSTYRDAATLVQIGSLTHESIIDPSAETTDASPSPISPEPRTSCWDLESAAFWDAVYDTLTSPRRGGPRFISEADRALGGRRGERPTQHRPIRA